VPVLNKRFALVPKFPSSEELVTEPLQLRTTVEEVKDPDGETNVTLTEAKTEGIAKIAIINIHQPLFIKNDYLNPI